MTTHHDHPVLPEARHALRAAIRRGTPSRRCFTLGRSSLLAVAGALTIGGAATAVALAPDPPAFDANPTRKVLAVAADQTAFPVLSRARQATDVIPSQAIAQIGDSRVGGKNIELSRAITTPSGKGWVIPGNGSICLAARDPASGPATPSFAVTCNSTAYAVKYGLLNMIDPADGTPADLTIVGPSGLHVRATIGGKTVDLPVNADGVAQARIPRDAKVTVDTPAATRQVTPPSSVKGTVTSDCGNGRIVLGPGSC